MNDDFKESYAAYALTVVVGFYLLITVLLWRGGLLLARRLPIMKKHGVSPPPKKRFGWDPQDSTKPQDRQLRRSRRFVS